MRILKRLLYSVMLVALAGAGGFYAAHTIKPEWIEFAAAEDPPNPAATDGGRKILYYRNPMGLPDTSPEPKKDAMGMDYIPVYADEAESDPTAVKVSVEKVQRSGVRSEAVEARNLVEAIHAPGTVKLDERRLRSITMRAEGFIEEVYAGATGQHVKAGEPLFRIYSPQIIQAQVDYRLAVAQGSREGGLRKLRNLGVPEEHIASLNQKGKQPLSMDWPSPVDGVLMTKNVLVGQRVMPGDELYQLADVSTVWIIADVAEQDIGRVAIGAPARTTVRALPGETFTGKVAFILPELKTATRTAQVRIELPNPGHRLIHEMYTDVTIEAADGDTPVLSAPASAIIDSGLRQVAIVDLGDGKFTPKEVKLGRRGGEYVEILAGLKAGDKVVTKANFLIDAESNLKAALSTLTAAESAKP